MTIRLKCQCGTPIEVSEAFAGRRTQCPSCRKILTIPGAAPQAPGQPGGASAASEKVVDFYCPCGQHIRMAARFAGRRARCRKCGREVVVPAESARPPAGRTPAKPQVPAGAAPGQDRAAARPVRTERPQPERDDVVLVPLRGSAGPTQTTDPPDLVLEPVLSARAPRTDEPVLVRVPGPSAGKADEPVLTPVSGPAGPAGEPVLVGESEVLLEPAAAGAGGGMASLRGRLPHLLTAVGGLLLVAAFAMPWWSLRMTPPSAIKRPDTSKMSPEKRASAEREFSDRMRKAEERLSRANASAGDFYSRHAKALSAAAAGARRNEPPVVRLWGFGLAGGIVSLIFGLLVLGCVGLAWLAVVPAVKDWLWWVLSGALALPALILTLVFIATSPGADAPPLMRQGVSIGPLLAVLGALAAIGGAVWYWWPKVAAQRAAISRQGASLPGKT